MAHHRNTKLIVQPDIPVRHDRVSRAGLIRSKKRLTAVNVHTVICLSSSTGRHQIIASVDLINMRSLGKQRVIHNGIEDDMFFPTDLERFRIQFTGVDLLLVREL